MGFQKRHMFSALLVLFSAFIFPFARADWSDMLMFSDNNLYFIWGRYSLQFNSVQFYDSPFPNPYDTQSIVVFWIISSIILALSVLSLAKSEHQSTKGRATIVVLFVLQIVVLAIQTILPLLVFEPEPALHTQTIRVASYPIPSVLSIIVFSALFLIQIRGEFSKLYHRTLLGAAASDSVV